LEITYTRIVWIKRKFLSWGMFLLIIVLGGCRSQPVGQISGIQPGLPSIGIDFLEKELGLTTDEIVKKGDVLTLKKLIKGFRIYLTAAKTNKGRIGRRSGAYSNYFPQKITPIRVTKAPEFEYLKEDFFKHAYKISTQSDMSGLKLEKRVHAEKYDIITSAVTDGTIQLTKDGPIVLMRHRQTTGGYPRVLNVIEADMDRLAQYPHGALVRFELIDIKMSVNVLLEYENILKRIEEDLV